MIEILKEYSQKLDDKKPQTTNKIKYIGEYVKNWLYVMSRAGFTKNINFVDCMCNAGIYKDGDLCTATEVYKLFYLFALENKDKNYCLYLNDIDKERTEICKQVCENLYEEIPENLHLYMNSDDVNDYIYKLINNDYLFNFSSITILYVDPYDFGTVKIPVLKAFANKYYCEILFNLFTSDWVRNRNNDYDKRIENIIGNSEVKINNKQELVNYIINELKVHKMKYSFNYEFHTQTNVELYQIIYFTPSELGLEKLKDALWATFKGKTFYKNKNNNINNGGQLSFLTDEMDEQMIIDYNVNMAKNVISRNLQGKHKSYNEIVYLILSKTMLCKRHLIKNFFQPLINQGKIIKLNENTRKNNYSCDFYDIMF
ncbi:MAG: three-Cys-motif partner protein TcmP [Clostridia bacterium]|nr:three-Cys-motif partner protein TcmP [Clostridia bacterium]